MYSLDDAESGASPNGGFVPGSYSQNGRAGVLGQPPSPKRYRKNKGISTLRLMLIGIAAAVFALVLLWSVLASNKPGMDPHVARKVGNMKGKLKGFPKVKRIMQRHAPRHYPKGGRGLKAEAAAAVHGGGGHNPEDPHEEGAGGGHLYGDPHDPITKEVDLEHLEHAGFDPEAAAYEDGLDPEDLGYDDDEEDFDESDLEEDEHGDGHEGRDHHDAHDEHGHGVYGHGDHGGGEHEHGGAGVQKSHFGGHDHERLHHVGDDSALHAGEVGMHHHDHGRHGEHGHQGHRADGQGGHHVHEHGVGAHMAGHEAHVDKNGHKLAKPPGGWRSGSEESEEHKQKIRVRTRLAEIFPLIDTNKDNYIDLTELLVWHDANGKNTSARRSQREFAWADTNHDGQVTLSEYLADLLPDNFKGNETMEEVNAAPVWKDESHDWIWHNKETFQLADEDHSGGLNPAEHFAFLHPEDAHNEGLHAYMRRQDVSDRDRNKDGKLDFEEFYEQMYHTLVEWETPDDVPEEIDPNSKEKATARFKQMDINGDGYLTEDELKSVFHYLHPTEHDYARIQAMHQMQGADNSGDGKLTLSEMMSNPYVFYSSSIIDDEEEEDQPHDEF